MKTLASVLIGCVMLFSTSCEKSVEPNLVLSDSDYFIFGRYYGFCVGENCVDVFRLEQNRLLEDSTDVYPPSVGFYTGNYRLLSKQKYEDAKDIVDFFPKQLLDESSNVIGHPDAGDWGGLYVEYNIDGVRKYWLIDQMKSNVPARYHEFIDKVNEKVDLLQ